MLARSTGVALWLAPALFLWVVLALVARIPTHAAAAVASVLFAVALTATSIAVAGAVVHASRRRRRARMRAVALAVGILAAIGALEVLAAARLVHWQLLLALLRGERQEYVADPDVVFRHAPGTRRSARVRSDIETACNLPASRADAITLTYDARGFRNPTTPARADIVLIGDSYVEGRYVSDDRIVSRVLEARLRRPVANLGVAGYGSAQELVVLERDGLPLEPRVVIWFFFEGNDLYNDHEFDNALTAPREIRATAWTARHPWWRRSFLRNAYAELRLLLSPIVPGFCPDFGIVSDGPSRGQRVLFWPEAAVPWTAFEQGRWERTKQTLGRGAALVRQHDARLLLVYVPHKFRVYRDFIDAPALRGWTLWPLPALFAEFCRAEGLACVDLTDMLRDSVRAGGMPHAATDSHWSEAGHRLVADRLAEIVSAPGWPR